MNLKKPGRIAWPPAIALFFLLIAIFSHTVSSETRVVCYYTNWSVYRPGTAKFSPQNINPYLCTHLIYAFGGFTKENSLKPFDKYQDIEKGGYAKFTGLKTYNKNLKTMLAIGGWNEGSTRFSPMVASPERRRELVKNTIKFLRQNHFDGLDLDWEYPSFRDGGKPRDRDNYAQLVQELREEFDRESEKTGRPRLLLTMAVPAGLEYINKGYDVPKLTKYLDWMNILSYDYHSAFEPAVNHHSPLFPLEEDDEYNFDGDLNIDSTIRHYIESGADRRKLVLGIPTYGRSYTLFNPDANELGAPADGPGDMGDATRENGYLAYYEICENVKSNGWKVIQPNPDVMGPYAYKDNQWVSYDDEKIARKKSEYVVENGLGGIMFWAIDNDDFRGNCHGKPYPLIEAAKEALIAAASRVTDDNLVSAPSKPTKPKSRTRTRTGSSSKSEKESGSNVRIQNSGGRQGGDDIPPQTINRKRIRPNSRNRVREEEKETRVTALRPSSGRARGRRRRPTSTTSTTPAPTTPSTLATTPMYKTPEPPTTPDPGSDFKCEDEGFFPHPRDCKKYFWCLSSGPSNLGIVAHQFTCPSGLYFNKAADSCDYTQNVFCNKKSKTTTTTTSTTPSTTTSTTTQPTYTTTRRASPRITAATSKTTYLYTTTTTTEEPEYYEEYEYDDDDFDEDSEKRGVVDSEEDPKVIKELIDLIKKVGGIEELEKYLKLQEDGTATVTASGSTSTPATISRSLYERVLSRANKTGGGSTSQSTTGRGKLSYATLIRNRRPGTLSTEEEETSEEPSKKGRPQYTTINRRRPTAQNPVEDEIEDEVEEPIKEEEESTSTRSRQFPGRRTNQLEYVTIRRTRPTPVTEDPEDEEPTPRSFLRNRQRGVPGEDIEDDVVTTPEYISIQRKRPTTEETTTSKYTNIVRRRPTTEASETQGVQSDTSSSTTVSNEGSSITTPATDSTSAEPITSNKNLETETTQPASDSRDGSTQSDIVNDVNTSESIANNSTSTVGGQQNLVSIQQTVETTDQAEVNTEAVSVLTDKTNQISEQQQQTNENQKQQAPETSSEKAGPQLFRPRPFAPRTRSTTAKTSAEVTEAPTKKVSAPGRREGNLPSTKVSRNQFQPGNRFLVRGKPNVGNVRPGNVETSTDSTLRSIDDYPESETISSDPDREAEFRARIRNRGKSRFTLPTSTAEPTAARRRRPVQSVTGDYDSDYEEQLARTYRPSVLQDLSSLTSADIIFQRQNNRKHIRRRPTTAVSQSTTSSTTEIYTTVGLRTGPKTLTLARKRISENLAFGRTGRRLTTPKQDTSSPANTPDATSTKSVSSLIRPRPFALRTTTSKPSEQLEKETPLTQTEGRNFQANSAQEETKRPLLQTTTESSETNEELNEVTEVRYETTTFSYSPSSVGSTEHIDSTESNSDKEYKTVKPDFDELSKTAASNEIGDTNTEIDTTQAPTGNILLETTEESTDLSPGRRRLRPGVISPTPKLEAVSEESPKAINRTRKIFVANRRVRPGTSSSETGEAKRFQPNVTTLRSNPSESNRSGLVRKIRPLVRTPPTVEEEEKIKLSETNISENGYTASGRNLPEDETGKQRRRKIVRRVRPGAKDAQDTQENDEQDFKSKRIRINDKSILKDDDTTETEQPQTRLFRPRLRQQNKPEEGETTDKVFEGKLKRVRLEKETFVKSESIDPLRSKRIRFNDKINVSKDLTKTKPVQEGNSDMTTDIVDDTEKVRTLQEEQYTTTNTNEEDTVSNDKDTTTGFETTQSRTDEATLTTEGEENKTELNGNLEKSQGSVISTTNSDVREDTKTTTELEITEQKPSSKPDSTTLNENDDTTNLNDNPVTYTTDTKSFRNKAVNEPNTDNTPTDDTTDVTDENTTNDKLDETETRPAVKPKRPLYKPQSLDFRKRGRNGSTAKPDEITQRDEIITARSRSRFVDQLKTTTQSSANVRNKQIVRKFRPGLVEADNKNNRTRKIIRRLRPSTTTTTETPVSSSESPSTLPDIPTTAYLPELATEADTTNVPEVQTDGMETTEFSQTTLEENLTTEFLTTEQEKSTSPTSPRPTRPSLIGRSRPAYIPRARTTAEARSTTPSTSRRKFTSPKPVDTDHEDETEVESKLYRNRPKYTAIVRSTTEKLTNVEEELITNVNDSTGKTEVDTTENDNTEQTTYQKNDETTGNTETHTKENQSDITTNLNLDSSTNGNTEVSTNLEDNTSAVKNENIDESTNENTNIPGRGSTDVSTNENTDVPAENTAGPTENADVPTRQNNDALTESNTDVLTEDNTDVRTEDNTDASSNDNTDVPTNPNISTDENENTPTSLNENDKPEYLPTTNPNLDTSNLKDSPEGTSQLIKGPTTEQENTESALPTEEGTQTDPSQTTDHDEATHENTSDNESHTTEEDNNTVGNTETSKSDTDKPHKPIRYRPSDRPKLKIKLNRTEPFDLDKPETDEPKVRKFIPSRTIDQRNRSRLAYRKDTTTEKTSTSASVSTPVPSETTPDSTEKYDETSKPVRKFYPTLKPTYEAFNFDKFNRNSNPGEEEIDEVEDEYEGEAEDEEPVDNPLIKYLQTLLNNKELEESIGTNEEEDETSEEVTNDETPSEEVVEPPVETSSPNSPPRFNRPISNRPSFNRPASSNQPNRGINRPPVVPNRPVNIPNRSNPSRNFTRQFNKPVYPTSSTTTTTTEGLAGINIEALNARNKNLYNKSRKMNIPHPGATATSTTVNDTVSEHSIQTTSEEGTSIEQSLPVAENNSVLTESSVSDVSESNIPVVSQEKIPVVAEENIQSTSEISVSGVSEGVINTATPIPSSLSSSTEEIIINTSPVTVDALNYKLSDAVSPEATTEQLSTLHHVFAEIDTPEATTTTPSFSSSLSQSDLSSPERGSLETTTLSEQAKAAIAAKSLERLIEVNRIVEVSFKENKVKNSSGLVESRVMLEGVPTLDRIGVINRSTFIKIVDGANETNITVPYNHAATPTEIITGRRFGGVPKIDIVAQLHAPDINQTKMTILNNTLHIIETMRHAYVNKTGVDKNNRTTSKDEAVVDKILNDKVVVPPKKEEPKFEINSKSSVVDYSHRDIVPVQILASIQPSQNYFINNEKTGRKLAIDSKSVVVNNHDSKAVFSEATTLPLEALFQNEAPGSKTVVTPLPTLKELVTGRSNNYLEDDQDLLESQNINGRVRIRILGQDNEYEPATKASNPVYAPIRVLNGKHSKLDEPVTLKADVVEITSKPVNEMIKIAPIEVSVTKMERVPIVRVESSQSVVSQIKKRVPAQRRTREVPSLRDIDPNTYFNSEIFLGGVNRRKFGTK